MKATFRNIGPIKQAELELGDLTIIAGQNNTGKTYLVYTLYGFLKLLERPIFFHPRVISRNELAGIVADLKKSGKAVISFDEYQKINRKLLKNISKIFSENYISEIFSSPNGEFNGAEFRCETENERNLFNEETKFYTREIEILKVYHDKDRNEIVFKLKDSKYDVPENFTAAILLLFRDILIKYFPEPFILSAERFGISLFYKELDFTKNRLVEELQKLPNDKDFDPFRFLESQSARYAKPIKDNIDFTRDLARIQKQTGKLQLDKFRSVDRIMNGYYKEKNNEIRFVSKKRGDDKFDIPLHLASSSARGVSDLYFYLKYVAKPGQLLIVDEPESHLSPTNQMMMARLLVFCVNSGLKVILTTHSDYLIKEINNLIMLDNKFAEKPEFLKKYKNEYTEADRLSPKSVKAYVCKNGELHPCSIDEQGIDMPIFDDAIDKINRISNQLGNLTTNTEVEDD